MNVILSFITNHAFYVLVGVSVIPVIFWMLEFKKELKINKFRQIAVYLACVYGIGLLSTYGIAFLENWILRSDWATRRGWSVFVTIPLYYLLVAKFTKRDINMTSDILGIHVMVIYAFGRTACLFQGCCLGKFIPGTEIRWPLVIIENVFIAVFVYLLGKKAYNRRFDGKSYPLFLVIYGPFRLFIELFREIPILPSYYGLFIGCVVFTFIGAVWLLILYIFKSSNKKYIGGKQ